MIQRRRGPGPTVRAYMKDMKGAEPVSREEEIELFRRVRQGDDEAREALARANLRFVVRVAWSYEGRGLPLEELIAEGNAGLMEALARFDESRGYKFITFAVWWIRQAILKALSQAGRAVRVPISTLNDAQRLRRQTERAGQELGRSPTWDELLGRTELTEARVERTIARCRGDVSLEAPRGEEGEAWRSSFPAVEPVAEEAVAVVELKSAVTAALEILDERERMIVERYFGLGGASRLNLAEIGEVLGLTRERVRQLRDQALARLRDECGAELSETYGLSPN